MEECESGRIGTIGNRVKGNLPWVQIPPPPPRGVYESKRHLVTKLIKGRRSSPFLVDCPWQERSLDGRDSFTANWRWTFDPMREVQSATGREEVKRSDRSSRADMPVSYTHLRAHETGR